MAQPPGHTQYQTEMQNERDEIEQGCADQAFEFFISKFMSEIAGRVNRSTMDMHILRFLKRGGSFMNTSIDANGRMPMDYAVQYKLERVIAYLQKAGQHVPSKVNVNMLWGNPHSIADTRNTDAIVYQLQT
jgi:hypothetical protein